MGFTKIFVWKCNYFYSVLRLLLAIYNFSCNVDLYQIFSGMLLGVQWPLRLTCSRKLERGDQESSWVLDHSHLY